MSKTGKLDGRRALVTGAARRTGRALALALAEQGADVAIHYRSSEEEARRVADEIQTLGQRSTVVQADLTDAEATARAVTEADRAIGPLDTLVNNVGAIIWKHLDELTPEEWRTSLDGTVTATWITCREILPILRRQGFGRIVNILDADADSLAPALLATPYKIGKAGGLILTKSLAKSEGIHGITVNALSPGVLEDSDKAVPLERIPAGRPGTYEDLAGALLFCVDRDSSYLNGAHIKVSGGYLI